MASMRYMNIGLAVAIAITTVGVLAFRDTNEAAMQAVALVGMLVGLAVGLGLDTRAGRRHNKQAQ